MVSTKYDAMQMSACINRQRNQRIVKIIANKETELLVKDKSLLNAIFSLLSSDAHTL